MTGLPKGLPLLLWVVFVHLAGIFLFTRGFLLTRLALSEVSSCESQPCSLPPAFNRAVVLIIDALRFDFVTPNPPSPPSPYYHNVLRTPAELSAKHTERSLLYYSYPDPPTTTLQRIKGLTTGSLPTFVDLGSNFGGSSILEDSIITQLLAFDKRIAFMGDDTWMTVFPTSFNMSWPYDSFNVEDLHTVDEGVIRHLFPLLHDKSKPWDFILGHFLGVDHVGHRLGPDHPSMKTKLEQMDSVLRQVVDALDDDTLLIVLGDHGMDTKGDHGGDGELETAAGLWLYSKSKPLITPNMPIPESFISHHTFPGASVPHRWVQQIDLVPTISLLMGLPIPFNNLGTVIPELFWHDQEGTLFERALDLNAAQIKRYLDAYRSSSAGGELDAAWPEIMHVWNAIGPEGNMRWLASHAFTRYALQACRMLWARFNISLIGLGLTLLVTSGIAIWGLYHSMGTLGEEWEVWSESMTAVFMRWAGVGAVTGVMTHFPLKMFVQDIGWLECLIFGSAFASSLSVILHAPPSISLSLRNITSLPIILILHTLAFMSNSFTFWEDRVVPFFLISSLVPFVLTGFTAPTSRLRNRILGFSLAAAICIRLMAISTVCREEQQPYCHVTYFAGSTITSPPKVIFAICIPFALALPHAVKRFLHISKSDKGIAGILLPAIIPLTLLEGTFVWLLEWAEISELFGSEWSTTLRTARTIVAWVAVGGILLIGLLLWWQIPLSLEVKTKVVGDKREVTVIGFSNAFGSPYFIFWLISFCIVYVTTQLTGQVVLSLGAVAVLSLLEVIDSVRDVRAMNLAFASSNPSAFLSPESSQTSLNTLGITFAEIVPFSLLPILAYYGTGHQATISSLQWKSAFILTSTLKYPYSAISVVLNTAGPILIFALAAPLIALWNVPPLPHPTSSSTSRKHVIRAALGVMTYHGWLLVGSALTSAWLRRHLMVWKVFAPRFMLAAVCLITVDLAVAVLGVGIGFGKVETGVARIFGSMPGTGAGQRGGKKRVEEMDGSKKVD